MKSYPSADQAISDAFHTLAKSSSLGLSASMSPALGDGLTPHERIAHATMILGVVRAYVGFPYWSAIAAYGIDAGEIDGPTRNQTRAEKNRLAMARWEKLGHIRRIAERIECPSRLYKDHVLGHWAGLNRLYDSWWAAELGVSTRTLRRWKHGKKNGIIREANRLRRLGLDMANDALIRVPDLIDA